MDEPPPRGPHVWTHPPAAYNARRAELNASPQPEARMAPLPPYVNAHADTEVEVAHSPPALVYGWICETRPPMPQYFWSFLPPGYMIIHAHRLVATGSSTMPHRYARLAPFPDSLPPMRPSSIVLPPPTLINTVPLHSAPARKRMARRSKVAAAHVLDTRAASAVLQSIAAIPRM
jgi:hypothetical protein